MFNGDVYDIVYEILIMGKNLKECLEGAGAGLVGGFFIGFVDADWLRVMIAIALIAYAAKTLQIIKPASVANSYKIAFSGIAAFLSLLIGLYINEQKLFKQTPEQAVSVFVNKGFSPAEARELYLKQIDPVLQKNAEPDQPLYSR